MRQIGFSFYSFFVILFREVELVRHWNIFVILDRVRVGGFEVELDGLFTGV